MSSESTRDGSRLAGYVVCTVLAVLAATFVLVFSTWTTLLVGAALILVLVLVLAALRNRQS